MIGARERARNSGSLAKADLLLLLAFPSELICVAGANRKDHGERSDSANEEQTETDECRGGRVKDRKGSDDRGYGGKDQREDAEAGRIRDWGRLVHGLAVMRERTVIGGVRGARLIAGGASRVERSGTL